MVNVSVHQAEVIEKVVARYNGDKTRAAIGYVPSKGLPMDLFVRCMIEGWNVIRTKEEKAVEF